MSYKLIDAAIEGNLAEVERLIDAGADVNFQDELGKTALMCAALKGHTDICKLLLEHKAEVDMKDEYGQTALMWAEREIHTETANFLKSYVALKNLDITLFKIGATIFGVVCVAGVVALIISPASIVAVGALGASLLASLGTSAASLVGVSVASKAIAITAGSAISAAVVGAGCFGLYKGLQAFVTRDLKPKTANITGTATERVSAADTTVGVGAGASAALSVAV